MLDFSQPVALMLVGILHFLEDKDEPSGTSPPCLMPCRRVRTSPLRISTRNMTRSAWPPACAPILAGGVTVQARDSSEFAALAFRDLESGTARGRVGVGVAAGIPRAAPDAGGGQLLRRLGLQTVGRGLPLNHRRARCPSP